MESKEYFEKVMQDYNQRTARVVACVSIAKMKQLIMTSSSSSLPSKRRMVYLSRRVGLTMPA